MSKQNKQNKRPVALMSMNVNVYEDGAVGVCFVSGSIDDKGTFRADGPPLTKTVNVADAGGAIREIAAAMTFALGEVNEVTDRGSA